MDASPEWANQTRKVTKAEDIVINRDIEDKLERGEAEPAEQATQASPKPSAEPEVHEDRDDSGANSPSSTKVSSERTRTYPRLQLIGLLPKKHDAISQWRQGRHLVIERRMPDDEVRYTAIDLQHQKYIVLWVMEMEMEHTT